jgi:type I restriction enzyme S subunit
MTDVAHLAVADLPVGWTWVPVAQLTAPEPRALTDGPFGSNLKTEHYTESGPRVIRLQNIGDGKFLDAEAHISQERLNFLRNHEARAGDIVLASLGENLPRACLVPDWLGPAIVKADCPRLRPHPDVNARYLMGALNSPPVRQQADAVMRGVGRPRLKLAELKKLLIPMPPRTEQDRIVVILEATFSRVDRALASFSDAREGVRAYERSLYGEAFAGGLVESCVNGETSIDLLERLGVTPIPASERQAHWPAHWGAARLGDLSSHVTSGSRDWKPYYGRGTGVFVLTQSVRMRHLDLSAPFHVDPPADDPARSRSAIARDDLLVTIVGANVGNTARVPCDVPEHYVCQSLALIRPRVPSMSRFLELYLAAPNGGQAFFESCFYGQGRPHISFEDIKRMPIPVPPLPEQEAIVSSFDRQVGAARSAAGSMDSAVVQARSLRQSVLHQAFTGQLANVGTEHPTCSPG